MADFSTFHNCTRSNFLLQKQVFQSKILKLLSNKLTTYGPIFGWTGNGAYSSESPLLNDLASYFWIITRSFLSKSSLKKDFKCSWEFLSFFVRRVLGIFEYILVGPDLSKSLTRDLRSAGISLGWDFKTSGYSFYLTSFLGCLGSSGFGVLPPNIPPSHENCLCWALAT